MSWPEQRRCTARGSALSPENRTRAAARGVRPVSPSRPGLGFAWGGVLWGAAGAVGSLLGSAVPRSCSPRKGTISRCSPPLTRGVSRDPLCAFSTAFRWCHCSARQSGDVTFCHSSKPWISDHMHCFLGCHSSYRGTKRRLYRKRIDFASFTSKECCIVAATSLLLAPNQYLCI